MAARGEHVSPLKAGCCKLAAKLGFLRSDSSSLSCCSLAPALAHSHTGHKRRGVGPSSDKAGAIGGKAEASLSERSECQTAQQDSLLLIEKLHEIFPGRLHEVVCQKENCRGHSGRSGLIIRFVCLDVGNKPRGSERLGVQLLVPQVLADLV